MACIVVLQLSAAFIIAIIAALVHSQAAGISALLGGLCYAVPNALFALRLYVGTKTPGKQGQGEGGVNPTIFFVGEFSKILTIMAALAAVIWLYHDLNWLAFLAGFIVVLKSYLILLFRS